MRMVFLTLTVMQKKNRKLIKTDENGNLLRDEAGNLEKLKYDN